ncbi:MAG: D-tyrosyl-tRNA(Tyr) deacylase [Bacteroidales bacterium 43_8]|nr:MAG: D-tyrosyl-tRNA(Tyr) deacylase [Bacteroidales bacterium 43_8]
MAVGLSIMRNKMTSKVFQTVLIMPHFLSWVIVAYLLFGFLSLENGIMNRSVKDIGGSVLIVSQFTLHASTKKGNRPSYIKAAKHEHAIPMYEALCHYTEQEIGKSVATGEFGADMQVELVNDGPVTIWIDSKNKE